MDISPVAAGQSQAAKSATGLAENFETFLTLLTTQLKNQDPLEPLDSNEFTSQLVQFTSVEQSISTNQNLEKLVSLTAMSSANAAVSYLGKEVTAEGTTSRLADGQAKWAYSLPLSSSQTTLTVTDKLGQAVFTTQGQTTDGSHTFEWDGTNSSGFPVPDGTYNLLVKAKDSLGNEITSKTEVTGIVRSVAFEDGIPVLDINGVNVRLGDVIAIVDQTAPGA
jgi:flagellar basal-body rod modification protein FlgD